MVSALLIVVITCIVSTSWHSRSTALGYLAQPVLHMNASRGVISGPSTLAQNVERLLTIARLSPKPSISHADLIKVVLTGNPYSIATQTTDYRTLQRLRVVFHPFQPQAQQGEGNSLLFVNDPQHWDSWLSPHWFDTALPNWHRQNVILWPDIQGQMDIETASRLRRDAGYVSPFDRVEISRFGNKPLSYCFSSLREGYLVRVAVPTGKVTQDFICSA